MDVTVIYTASGVMTDVNISEMFDDFKVYIYFMTLLEKDLIFIGAKRKVIRYK